MVVLGIVFFIVCWALFVGATSAGRERRWILDHDCFVTTGYSYNKQSESVSSSNGMSRMVYRAKIWDGNSVYLKGSFPISKADFEKEEILEFRLYFYKDKNGHIKMDTFVV